MLPFVSIVGMAWFDRLDLFKFDKSMRATHYRRNVVA